MEELKKEVKTILGTHVLHYEVMEQLLAFIKRYGDNLYNEGYDEGNSHGHNTGYYEGKREGYDKGKEDGFEDGKFNATLRIEHDPSLSLDERRRIKQRIWG